MSITSYPELVRIAGSGNTVSFGGTNTDAFGRLRVSQPYTLFDSQNRYGIDSQFSTSTVGSGAATHLSNEASEMTAVIKLLMSSGEPIFIDFKSDSN
jgi:hypothetical protein